MRRIYAFNRVSADGYFSKPDGNLDWAVPDDELDQQAVAGMSSTDAILFGRTTYPIAIGQLRGPEHGLPALAAIADGERLARYPFYPAARAELELVLGHRALPPKSIFEKRLGWPGMKPSAAF